MRMICLCVAIAMTSSACVSGLFKRSETRPTTITQVKHERVELQCDLSDPPLPKLPTATNAEDALREEVDWSEPWALLVKQYEGLRKCVAEHNEKAKTK